MHIHETCPRAVNAGKRSLGDLLGLVLHEAMHRIHKSDGTLRYSHPVSGLSSIGGHAYPYPGTEVYQITQATEYGPPCARPWCS